MLTMASVCHGRGLAGRVGQQAVGTRLGKQRVMRDEAMQRFGLAWSMASSEGFVSACFGKEPMTLGGEV